MIVKDEEKSLDPCLKSVQRLVKEMIIVDTGSQDATKEIALRFSDKVFYFPWNNDFSAARNFALQKATQDWILILDADELLSEKDFEKMSRLMEMHDVDAFVLDCRNYTQRVDVAGFVSSRGDRYPESAKAPGFRIEKILRFFRNKKEYVFEGKVHETVAHSIKRSGGKIFDTDVVIHHFGQLHPEKIVEKKERYVALLKKRLEEKDFGEKSEDFICWELSRELGQIGRNDEAIAYLERALALEEEYPYLLGLGGLYLLKRRFDDAEKMLKRAVLFEPLDSAVHHNLGVVYSEKGEYQKAIKKFERVLELNPSSANAYYNLGVVYTKMGKKDKAVRFFDKAGELHPGYRGRIQ